jgi:dienelactone hydrolase
VNRLQRIELPAATETPWEQNNRVPALLAMPSGLPRAGIVTLHGYRGAKETIEDIITGLADRGYAVVAPDLPLHGERALGTRGDFEYPFFGEPVGVVQAFENALADIATCGTYLRSILGPGSRLGVSGWSLGGCLTILTMARMPGTFTTGVSVVGAAKLARLILTSSITTDIRDDLLCMGYDEERLTPLFRPIEATERASDVRNLLMIGGVDDEIVPGELVRETFAEFADPSNELVMFDGAGHYPPLDAVAEVALPFLARTI